MSLNNWVTFFKDAGVQASVAKTYSAIFAKNNIAGDTLEDLDREDLVFMGISALGDIKRILKYIKKVDKKDISLKYKNFGVDTIEIRDDDDEYIEELQDESGKNKLEVISENALLNSEIPEIDSAEKNGDNLEVTDDNPAITNVSEVASGMSIDHGEVRDESVVFESGSTSLNEKCVDTKPKKRGSESQEVALNLALKKTHKIEENNTRSNRVYGVIKVDGGSWLPVDADSHEKYSDNVSELSSEDGTTTPKMEEDVISLGPKPSDRSTCELCNNSYKSKNYNRPTIRVFINSHVLCDDHKAKLEAQIIHQPNPNHKDKTAWRHGCQFICNVCKKKISNRRAMMIHSIKEHGKLQTV